MFRDSGPVLAVLLSESADGSLSGSVGVAGLMHVSRRLGWSGRGAGVMGWESWVC